MLGEFFRKLRIRAAARRYAQRLGPRLRRDYGTREFYSRQQIEAAARKAKLPATQIELGFAGFMAEADFVALTPAASGDAYAELRSLLRRYTRRPAGSAGTVAGLDGSDAIAGGPSWPPDLGGHI
jgi:hypothetical protein